MHITSSANAPPLEAIRKDFTTMADIDPLSAQDASSFDPTQLSDSLSKTLEADMDMAIEDGQPPKHPTVEHSPELRMPTQKDMSLREFMSKMDDYAPIV